MTAAPLAPTRRVAARAVRLAAIFPRAHAGLAALNIGFSLEQLYREEHIRGERQEVVCIAPHGGGIEPWTRFLAQQVQEKAACDYWSAYADFHPLLERGVAGELVDRLCKSLHVTSHRIHRHPELYTELHSLLRARRHPYRLALALHGKADDTHGRCAIEVGGTSRRRHALRERLESHGMRAAIPTNGRAGRNALNIVNLLARESIQLEIPTAYRRNPIFGHAIVQAAADVCALEDV